MGVYVILKEQKHNLKEQAVSSYPVFIHLLGNSYKFVVIFYLIVASTFLNSEIYVKVFSPLIHEFTEVFSVKYMNPCHA